MTIFIDNRGKGEKELYLLLNSKHLAIEQTHLDSGDICFGDVGIERKEVNDLVNSVIGKNKHYWEQLKVLKVTYKKPIVIVEGIINYDDKIIAGIIFKTLLRWNIPYINTLNLNDTADKIYKMFTAYGSSKCKGYPPKGVIKEDTPERIRWAMLQCIRGIGTQKATEIIKLMPDFIKTLYYPDCIEAIAKSVKLNKPTRERFFKVFGVK